MSWKLSLNGGAAAEASDFGMINLKLSLISQGADSLTMDADGMTLEAPDVFPYGQKLTLTDPAGVVRFVGTVIETPSSGDGKRGESRSYTAVGPWWDLDNLVYQLHWKYYMRSNGQDWTATDVFSPHLLLGADFNGANISSRTQVLDVLNYAITQGIGVQIGTILPDRTVDPKQLYPPIDEVRDITCAEAIKKMLRWHPDAITWFDYTGPVPILNIKVKADLTKQRVSVPALNKFQDPRVVNVQSLEVRPRYDLQRKVVAISFISKGTVNDKTTVQLTQDIYPTNATGRERNALALSVDLQGAKIETLKAPVETITRDFTSKQYWIDTIPELSDPRVDPASIVGPNELTRSGAFNFPNELLNGAVAEWMVLANGQPVGIEEDVIAAKFSFLIYVNKDSKTPDNLMQDQIDHVFNVRRKMTNAVTGTYSTLQSFESADLIPVGLAQYLYNALSPLTYEGQVSLIEDYCKGSVSMGNVLDVSTGPLTALTTMDALVQRITLDIDLGKTTAVFGPPPHLSAGDLVDLLKVGRRRLRFTNRLTRSTGENKDNDLELPKYTEATDTQKGAGTLQKLRVKGTTVSNVLLDGVAGKITGSTGYSSHTMVYSSDEITLIGTTSGTQSGFVTGLTFRTADCQDAGVPRPLAVKKVEVCISGVTKHMLVIASDPF